MYQNIILLKSDLNWFYKTATWTQTSMVIIEIIKSQFGTILTCRKRCERGVQLQT